MRTATVSLLAGACLLQAAGAFAADLDYGVLRGSDYDPAPVPVIDWSGVYAGGHGGWSATAHNFGNGLQSVAARALLAAPVAGVLSATDLTRPDGVRTTGGSFGAIAGYNVAIEELVFGIEGDYTSLDQSKSSSTTVYGTLVARNDVSLTGTAYTSLIEYGTVRGRVGYALDAFMPFVTAGVAFGHARVSDAVVGTSVPATRTASEKYAAGFAAGFGLDFALTSNIFLRAEYQYVLFEDFGSHKANVNTVRAAAAVKF